MCVCVYNVNIYNVCVSVYMLLSSFIHYFNYVGYFSMSKYERKNPNILKPLPM